ncbi:uncharacterized protein LOC144920321 isoform X6 [Branchiostoma floridae x Branchiostoma belcheri]
MDETEGDGKEKKEAALVRAAEKGDTDRVKQLLAEGVNPNAAGRWQRTALYLAAGNGHHETVSALLTAGADVNTRDQKQRTPLHLAAVAEICYHETVSVLLTAGADVNARDDEQMTPLHWAAANGHQETVSALLTAGADVNARDKSQSCPLHWAAENGHHETVSALLTADADMNAKNKRQYSPLHLASENGDRDTVSALLAAGADVNAWDNCQSSPLHWAALNDKHETVSALLTAGADVKALDKWRNTPLHDAATLGHPKCAEILLQHGADTGIRNKEGRTANDIAADKDIRGGITENTKEEKERVTHGRKEVLELLQKQNNRVSEPEKGYDPVLVRYFEKGMTKAKKDCPLIQEAAKESGKTEEQVRTFIGNYRKSLGDKKRRQSTDDTVAGHSGFTGYHEDSGMLDEDIRNNDYERERVSQSQKEILKLPRQQNDGVSKRKKGHDPVLVRFYEDRGMTVAYKNSPLIEEAAKKSGKTAQQVRNFIANYRRSQAFGKRSLPTDDTAAGYSGFTGSHNSGMSEEPDESEEAMEEVLSEQEEPRTETLSRTHEAVEQYSDRNNPTDEGETSQVQQEDEAVVVRSKASQIQPKKSGKRKSSNSGPLVKRPKQAVAQPGPITIAEVTDNSIRISWTEAAGSKDSYRISISNTDGVTAPSASVNPGDPLEYTFTGLTAGTEYTISVVTVSDGANSVARIETQRTTVAQPGPITIAETTENSTRIIWTEAAGAKDSYDISISPDTGVTNPTESVNPGGPLEHTFTTLTAGTEYTISALTVSGGKCSDPTIKVQRTKFTSVLLVNHEYGTSYGGPSTTSREVAQFLKLHGATVHATALQASEEDKRCAEEDGVRLHLPFQKARKTKKPSLEWLTDYHSFHYPDIPTNIKCVVGHADVTSGAAKSIQENHCERAKLILFNHDMLEDTEYYKETKRAMAAGKMMEDILEDAKNADAVFSLGKRIYNYFETKYKSLGESKPSQHFLFLPRPSPVFEAISVSPGGGEKVVLSVGRVTEVDKLKGHDLVARAMGEVAEKITNIRLCVRGIDENDFEASKRILEENLHSGKIKPTLLPCGTQEDIAQDMRQAHLVLMPSRAEPFGLIGLEAIAAGIPVLISDKSGLADMIKDLIKEEKCSADMRHRIVKTSVRESDLEETAKRWAERIEDSLDYSTWEFKKAAEYKNELLESTYWEESHQNLLRACGLID